MLLQIYRRLSVKEYRYILNNDIKGYLNFTYGVLPIKIQVSFDGNLIELKQSSYVLKLINSLPILNSEMFTPFKLRINGEYVGKVKKVLFKPVLLLYTKGNIYELRQHNNNYISLMKNNIQIALYKKNNISIKEENSYSIICVDDNIKQFIMLFCILIDSVFYANDRNIAYLKYEKNFLFHDKFVERTLWKPEDIDVSNN